MQLTNAPEEKKFLAIEDALHPDRLRRYLLAAGKDKSLALKYYMWNCEISEAFYLPLHFCEVVCRNAIHKALLVKYRENLWYHDHLFLTILDERFRQELLDAIANEREQHGDAMTVNHIVSALTFGFWEHLTTKKFERLIWAKGIHGQFPFAPKQMTFLDLQSRITGVRRWRNRIAHHRAVFDKRPTYRHQEAIELIKWVCGETAAWVIASSDVPRAINSRPK